MFDCISGTVAHTAPYLAVVDAQGLGFICHAHAADSLLMGR